MVCVCGCFITIIIITYFFEFVFFNYLFENLLEDGGYYIIEDVETSYWDPLSELYGYEIGYLNVVDYFSKLTHNVNYKYNGFNNTLKIESILFTSNCIVI